MCQHIFLLACLWSAAVIYVSAVPLPANNQELDVLQIPLTNGKEIDVLTLSDKDQEQAIAERNKRTIGLLRELFPDITKQIDGIVNRIIAQVIRVAGPSLLPALLGGNRPTTIRPAHSDDSDFDDFEDGDDVGGNDVSPKGVHSGGTRVEIELPTFAPEAHASETTISNDNEIRKVSEGIATTPSTTITNKALINYFTTPTPTTTTTATAIKNTTTSSTMTWTTTMTVAQTTETTTPTAAELPTNAITTTLQTESPTTSGTSSSIETITTTESLPGTMTEHKPSTPTDTPNRTTTTTNIIRTPTLASTSFSAATATDTTAATTTTTEVLTITPIAKVATNDVDESQIVAIIQDLNRLLNRTNYFITTRDKLTSTSPAAAITIPTTTTSQPQPIPSSSYAINNVGPSTVKITKLHPNVASETQIDLSAINKQLEETIRVARQVKEAEAAAQAVANLPQQHPPQSNQPLTQQSEQQQTQQQHLPQQQPDQSDQQSKLEEAIQLSFNNEVLSNSNDAKPVSNDLQISESKSPAIDDLSLDSNEDHADLDDRNKRFLNFGGGGLAGSASGTNANVNAGAAGSSGGSGNFLFDIVRLFSGSVQTQNRDEAANSPKNTIGGSSDDSDSNSAADGYTEGIPGPVTRLVVLANRGLANLVQDMILRVAATSEKFVNFNAKLITALI